MLKASTFAFSASHLHICTKAKLQFLIPKNCFEPNQKCFNKMKIAANCKKLINVPIEKRRKQKSKNGSQNTITTNAGKMK